MPRSSRFALGGVVFHVLNRAVGRRSLFDKPGEFEAFERVLVETLHLRAMRVCGYCWMSNHWHFVLSTCV